MSFAFTVRFYRDSSRAGRFLGAQQLQDRREREAARLQKAHLTRLLALVGRRAAETALPERRESCVVVELHIRERRRALLRAHTFGLQLCRDPASAVTAGLLRNERMRV